MVDHLLFRILLAVASTLLALTVPAIGASPAETKIELARAELLQASGDRQFNALAAALLARARETGDESFLAQAGQALAQARELAPSNLDTESLTVRLLLGRREYAEALERARALSKQAPDNVASYGYVVEAAAALGKYAEAEQAAQWMLNLRSSYVISLARAASMREVFGDTEGALDLMQRAYQRIDPQEGEERAWHLTRIAEMYLEAGKSDAAENTLNEALSIFPDYHLALGQLARVRLAQGRAADAVAIESKRLRLVPRAENLYALASALAAAGRSAEARLVFSKFELAAKNRTGAADNANRELVLYYVNYARKPAAALSIAAREIALRQDVRTVEAYVIALKANGKKAEALRQLRLLTAEGVCDAGLANLAVAVGAAGGDRRRGAENRRCVDACCGKA